MSEKLNEREKEVISYCQRWNHQRISAGGAMYGIYSIYLRENKKAWRKVHGKRKGKVKD